MSDDLRSVPGVGPATEKKLIEAGIKTPAQLIEAGEVGAIGAGISKATAAKIVNGASTLSVAVKQVASKAKDVAESTASKAKDVAESTASKAKDVASKAKESKSVTKRTIEGQKGRTLRGLSLKEILAIVRRNDAITKCSRVHVEPCQVRTTDQSRGTTHEGSMQGVVRASIARFQIDRVRGAAPSFMVRARTRQAPSPETPLLNRRPPGVSCSSNEVCAPACWASCL